MHGVRLAPDPDHGDQDAPVNYLFLSWGAKVRKANKAKDQAQVEGRVRSASKGNKNSARAAFKGVWRSEKRGARGRAEKGTEGPADGRPADG